LAAERIKADPIAMSALGYTTYQNATTPNPPTTHDSREATLQPPNSTPSGQFTGTVGGYSAAPSHPHITAAAVPNAHSVAVYGQPVVSSIPKPGGTSMRVIKPGTWAMIDALLV